MAGGWRRALASERARRITTGVVLAASALALAWPLLGVEWLPFVDYPQHLGTVAAIHGQGDPTWSRYFVVEYSRSQYLLLYVLADWLAYPLGVEAASRLTAVLSIAGLPLALGLYLRENGREPLLGAAAVGVALHTYVFWGFLNYAAGMAVAVVALAAFVRLCNQPTSRNTVLFGLAALLAFYTHAQTFAWLGIAVLLTGLAMAPKIGRSRATGAAWRGLVALVPSALGVLLWLSRSEVIEHGEAGVRSGHAAQVTEDPARFSPIVDTLNGIWRHSFEIYRDGAGLWIATGFFGVVVVMLILRGAGEEAAPPKPEAEGDLDEEEDEDEVEGDSDEEEQEASDDAEPAPPAPTPRSRLARAWTWLRGSRVNPTLSLAPELVVAATFAMFFFAPVSYRLIQPISHRFLPLALALLCCLGPRVRLRPAPRAWLAVLLVSFSLFVGAVHSARFEVTDEEMGQLSEALEHTEPGGRLLGLIYDQGSQTLTLATYLHAHQYYQARVGGMACFSFVEFPKSPVQWAPDAAPPPFPPRFEWTPQRYEHARWGDSFDYWLVRHPPGRSPPNPLRIPPNAPGAPRVLFESPRWTLYGR